MAWSKDNVQAIKKTKGPETCFMQLEVDLVGKKDIKQYKSAKAVSKTACSLLIGTFWCVFDFITGLFAIHIYINPLVDVRYVSIAQLWSII